MYEVYLLDDEKWLLESLHSAINWNKYNATVVAKSTNSLEAYKEIKYRAPDIIFTDIRMPDMNGLELMEKLIAEKCKSVFVVVTGHAEFDYAKKALENDASSYCLKPFDKEEIIEALLKAQQKCEDKKILEALHDREEMSSEETKSGTYKRVCDIVNDRFASDITLQQIAEEMHLNYSYLSEVFKKEAGMTYSSYLTKVRLEYACQLLVKTSLSIQEVASKSGFGNYFYFARTFKKKMELTPSQYRENRTL